MRRRYPFLVGIDEVGRGPLAGPVAIGVVRIPWEFDWSALPGVTDSKRLTPARRETIAATATALRHQRRLDFAVAQVGPSVIDAEGIVAAIDTALARAIARLALDPRECELRLDGGLQAAPRFQQASIIKGDQLEPAIGLASIIAKVTRDRYMTRIDRRYPHYGFAAHKGYGTQAHRAAICQYGRCPIHRVSYCKKITS